MDIQSPTSVGNIYYINSIGNIEPIEARNAQEIEHYDSKRPSFLPQLKQHNSPEKVKEDIDWKYIPIAKRSNLSRAGTVVKLWGTQSGVDTQVSNTKNVDKILKQGFRMPGPPCIQQIDQESEQSDQRRESTISMRSKSSEKFRLIGDFENRDPFDENYTIKLHKLDVLSKFGNKIKEINGYEIQKLEDNIKGDLTVRAPATDRLQPYLLTQKPLRPRSVSRERLQQLSRPKSRTNIQDVSQNENRSVIAAKPQNRIKDNRSYLTSTMTSKMRIKSKSARRLKLKRRPVTALGKVQTRQYSYVKSYAPQYL